MIEVVNVFAENLIRIKLETRGHAENARHIAFAESYLMTMKLSAPELSSFKFRMIDWWRKDDGLVIIFEGGK